MHAGGVMGRSEPPHGAKPTPLYFSNPDVIYANEFPAPRFGQGCFAAALSAVYAAVTQAYCCIALRTTTCTLLLRTDMLVCQLAQCIAGELQTNLQTDKETDRQTYTWEEI